MSMNTFSFIRIRFQEGRQKKRMASLLKKIMDRRGDSWHRIRISENLNHHQYLCQNTNYEAVSFEWLTISKYSGSNA